MVRTSRVVTLMAFALLFSWGLAGVFAYFGGQWGTAPATLLSIVYVFGPLIAAILTCKTYGQSIRGTLSISLRPNRWFLIAWLGAPVLAFLSLGTSILLPGVSFSAEMTAMYEAIAQTMSPEEAEEMRRAAAELDTHPAWLWLWQALALGPTLHAIAAFGEESGWRGYLQREFRALGFWRASFVIGLLWGIWYAPLILLGHNYPSAPVVGAFMMVLMTVASSPVLGYVALKGRSVVAAAILHGTLNASYGLSIMFLEGGTEVVYGLLGIAGVVVYLMVDLVIYLLDPEPAPAHSR